MLPDPSLLDTKSWEEGVLPNMGPRLGIFNYNFNHYPSSRRDKYLDSNFYPPAPMLKLEEWQNIIDYYTAMSPDSLPERSRKNKIRTELPLFSVKFPSFRYDSAAISFIKIDESSPLHQLVVCDVLKQKVFRFNSLLQLVDAIDSPGSIVDMEFYKDKIIACDIGKLNPTNGKFGKGLDIVKGKNQRWGLKTKTLFDSLARPVQITPSDINGDGLMDYIVCEFGNLTGSLSWMEGTANKKYIRHQLKALPGAIKVWVNDYNNDGMPDLWALFTQGNESIILFTNKGNGRFDQRELLAFPPVYGSTYFELCDFNNDGMMDIVYTCGDNADFSMVLKPYHGVYVFLNDGNNNFRKEYFFPMNGCFKAIPRDYDGDGDIDIAVIAFFADYARHPEEGFVYLENKNNLTFEPYTFSQSILGRWLTMDAGDLDGDGKIDIILGNFSIRPSTIQSATDWKKSPPFIVLKNSGK